MALDVHISHPLRSFRLELDLSAEAGETLALVGPSGAGKTSVLRAIAGLLRPERGRIALDGEEWLDTERGGLDIPPERRRVGFVFQEYALFPHMRVRANVAFGGGHEQVGALLERFGIAHLADERPSTLSGGERQRVALARAFLADAPVLILDEATSSLDSESEGLIQQAMERLMKGRTSIVIAHRLSTVRSLDRILVFDRGEIVEQGTHAALTARPGGVYRGLFELQATEFGRVSAAE
jgi:ATP-binding cassette, subfamily B, bacterial